MKVMKKVLLVIMIVTSSVLAAGQNGYETLLRAVSLSERGEYDEAAGILSAMGDINTDAGMLLVRGEILLGADRLKEAKRDFMAAENLKPGSGMYGLAACAAAEGEARAAAVYLEAHLKSQYRKVEPEILLNETFRTISTSPEWKAIWKKDWYKGYERKSWEIDHYLKAGKTDLAQEAWNGLSALYPEMPVTEYCSARILMSKGRHREAAAILEPLTVSGVTPAKWLYTLAEARAGEGSWYAAATVYERLMDEGQPDPQLLLLRSQMLIRAGDREAAKKDMEKYLAIDPDNTEALGLMGRTYAEEGAIYEALPFLNANVDKHPGEPAAFRLRGDAWLAARSWEQAAEDYTMSLDLDPDNAGVNLNMGIALINCGRTDDACHYLRKARSLGEKSATDYLARHCIK
jgi:tetratricopeptide (TPR) repeat protein